MKIYILIYHVQKQHRCNLSPLFVCHNVKVSLFPYLGIGNSRLVYGDRSIGFSFDCLHGVGKRLTSSDSGIKVRW